MPDWGWSLGGGKSAGNSGVTTQGQGQAQAMVAAATPPLPYPGGVDQTGYIHADPHWTPQLQQQYEQAINGGNQAAAQQINDAAWRDYDVRRASASTAEKANMDAYHKAKADAEAASATPESTTAGIERNPRTGKWDWLDPKTKQWSEAASFDEIWAKLTPDEQALHPRFWYDNLADNQDAIEDSARTNRYHQAQTSALSGTPTLRSTPVRF
jgi:hypothetical protein